MQPQRETTTDSLASIMQILQLGFRTGTLTVERSTGDGIEEGFVVFNNGQVVSARANRYIGVSAFNYLRNWGTCRFSFLEGVTTGPLPAELPSSPPYQKDSGSLTPPPFQRFTTQSGPLDSGALSYGERSTGPLMPARSATGEAALYNQGAMQLSRQQRRLLLLINGQRSPDELARLMARTVDEIRLLLSELEQAGFILQ